MANRRSVKYKDNLFLKAMAIYCIVSLIVVVVLAWYVLDVARGKVSGADYYEGIGMAGNLVEKTFKNEIQQDARFTDVEIIDGTNSEVKAIVMKVSKHILLPKGNITVASINDVESLRNDYKYLFDYAKNGDKLLKYPNGIIIYDAYADKIVDVWHITPLPKQTQNNGVTG